MLCLFSARFNLTYQTKFCYNLTLFSFTYDLLQRITEDVQKFSSAISELFSYTFKPVLDIILFTRSLARTIG